MKQKEKEEIIQHTADEVMRRLRNGGKLSVQVETSREKAEAILRQYPKAKKSDSETERRAAAVVDAFLEENAADPYIDAVRLFYFDGLTNAAVSQRIYCDDTTCRRNRSRLVRAFVAFWERENFA